MIDNIARILAGMSNNNDKNAVQKCINAVADRMASAMLSSAGVVIFGASSVNAKTGATPVLAVAANAIVSVAASTTLTTAVVTTPQNRFNIYCYYVDNAGAITSRAGVDGATLGAVIWPDSPQGKTMVGGFTVNPTSAAFIGGTTALDAANTNVVFFSTIGAFDPSITLGV